MLSEVLRFIKDNQYREVLVMKDGTYRIRGMNGGTGKLHDNASEYISHLLNNGWEKCNLGKYLSKKYRR